MTESTDLARLGIAETADLIRSGAASADDLVESCLRRVDAIEPQLRAWARLNRDEARACAREGSRAGAKDDRPLPGIPIGVKDNIATAGTPTTAGSRLLADDVAATDATAVRRLRDAGAIVLGKTACTELATNDPAPTRNPWNPAYTPGGSSAGSGAAIATGMCFATVDTQTAGDILRPAAYTGVVGLKPTYGRISRRGVVPVAWSIDTVGVQARSVRDAALVFAAMADDDLAGRATLPDPPRLGVISEYFRSQAGPEVSRHTDSVAEALARAGAEIIEFRAGGDFPLAHAAHRTVTFTECAAVHAGLYHRHADEMGPKLRALLELGMVTPAVSYVQAQRVRARLVAELQDGLGGVDAVLTAAAPNPPSVDQGSTGNSALNIPWTFCGFPAISIPTGLNDAGLPIGTQLVSPLFTEPRLLAVAGWCEQILGVDLPVPPTPRTTR